jgi:hypothetical protein
MMTFDANDEGDQVAIDKHLGLRMSALRRLRGSGGTGDDETLV